MRFDLQLSGRYRGRRHSLAVLGLLCHKTPDTRGIGGLADGFYTKEIETAEFSLRTWLSGRVCYYVPHITLTIVFRHNYPPDHRLAYWGSDLIAFTRIHFEKETVAKIRELVIACDGEQPGAPDREGLEEAREKYLGLRQHDPLWFANRFDITL